MFIEQGKTELHRSTKVEEKLSQAVGKGRKSQPASSSKNLEDNEMQEESRRIYLEQVIISRIRIP